MNKLLSKIINTPIIQKPLDLSKKLALPGFDGMPIYNVIHFFITGIKKSSLTTRASSLAFRFFLALFPSIIFLFALIPYIPIDNFQIELLNLIKTVLPNNAYELSISTIDDLISKKDDSLLSFGFLFALYLASDGVNSMINAFNESYHVEKKGGFFETRLRSLLVLFLLTILMILAIGLIVFSGIITKYLISHNYLSTTFSVYALQFGEFIVLLFLFFLGISSIYYFGNNKNNKFRFISAGSSLATLLSILLSVGFAYYVNNFSNYNKIYGSIGTLMVIMLWLYFNSLVLLIGFELNASILHAKTNNEKK
jgi:membrane protein